MTLSGQWITSYTGSNTGTLVVEIDRVGDHYAGTAVAWDDNPSFPNSMVTFVTLNTEKDQILRDVEVKPVDNFGNPISREVIKGLETKNGLKFLTKVNIEIKLKDGSLEAGWQTEIGTYGNGTASPPKTRASIASELVPNKINTWAGFKSYVSTLERKRYIFRGQENSIWRLRASFYRSGRSDINRYQQEDVNTDVNKLVSGLVQHTFDFSNAQHFLAALHLAQHHGYPTPLLDWTWSPYVAAFFAYRNIKGVNPTNTRKKVRIFKFDSLQWNRLPRADKMFPFRPHVTVLDPLAFANNRAVPQQAVSTFSNLDDVETHIQTVEQKRGQQYLEVFDLPVRLRGSIMHELALMGVTAGSLFPGLDGAFEGLRERNFT